MDMPAPPLQPVRFAAGPHPLAAEQRGTLWHLLAHVTGPRTVTETVHLAPSPAGAEDFAIAERLLGVFLAMLHHQDAVLPPEARAVSGIWEMSKHAFHGPLYRLAEQRDTAGLAQYMRNAMRETLTHGLGPGQSVFEAMREGPGLQAPGLQTNVLIIIDRLASLAEALGVLPYENPEQGRYGENAALPAAELVARIEAALGYPIGRPPVMGAFGLAAGDQIIDSRVADDAYSAHRIKSVMSTFGLAHVAEIGGGLGGCALQATRAGIAPYTIFDLPAVLLVQGWLLMKVFGGDMIGMFGEPGPDRAINLRPYWEFGDRTRPFTLVFNRDSLPELPRAHAQAYITEIAARGSALLSINQESQGPTDSLDIRQLWVRELAAAEPGLRCIARHPYWTREGYVEELYLRTSP